MEPAARPYQAITIAGMNRNRMVLRGHSYFPFVLAPILSTGITTVLLTSRDSVPLPNWDSTNFR
jgi:hypothetical protein